MIDLDGLWRDAKAATPVCAVTGATKNMILNAITEGARTLEDIEKTVPLCGGECALRNVSGCGPKPEGCPGTRSEKCGGCTGCGA